MSKEERIKLFKDKYEKEFNQTLKNDDRNKGREIINAWQEEYERLEREV